MAYDKIAVVDFGGQYAHLIATKIRRLRVLAEILDPQDPIERFREYRGIVLSGSPALASQGEESSYTRAIYDLETPILGLCFGHQEIAKHYGGAVEATEREYGAADLHLVGDASPVLRGLGPVERVFMSHGDTVTRLPEGFVEIGYSTLAGGKPHRNAAIASEKHRRYGFQYHPEVDDTLRGSEMLRNFVIGICGARPEWTMGSFKEHALERIRAEVGDRRVLLLVSGGVDSSVTAKLLSLALGDEALHLLHVDSGLMRKDESDQVMRMLERFGLGKSLHRVDAEADFLAALEGLVDPEKKRLAVGNTFLDVVDREALRLDLASFVLGQGTIYPDTIETGGSKRADRIKTHHNRVPVIEEMIRAGRVVEPLRELYKVEVRELAGELGLEPQMFERHPFPGPGLAIRALCSDGAALGDDPAARVALDAVLAGTGLAGRILPLRSVGVKADLRSYERPVLLSGPDPGHERLTQLATAVCQRVRGVNRCLFRLDRATDDAVEVVPATVTRERLDLLREVDAAVMNGLERHGAMASIWQCPTVIVPLRVGGRGREMVVLRPVLSERGMTARPAPLPPAVVSEVLAAAARLPAVGAVALDLTSKPPGTIEWE